jgi:predicted lipoprotein with Yx(FWY)xxD motif
LIRAALLAAGSATLIAIAAPLASGAGRTPHAAAPKSVKISAKTVKGLGTVLVSSTGRTLYVFAPDNHKKVTCGPKLGCETVWPPEYISATGKPVAGAGVQQSLLGSDPDPYAPGKHVVTYKGWPLYLYISDKKAGQALGQDTKGSGGLWYVITTAGAVIKHKPTGGTTSTTTTSTTTTSVNLCPGATDTDGDGDQNVGGVDDGDGCL